MKKFKFSDSVDNIDLSIVGRFTSADTELRAQAKERKAKSKAMALKAQFFSTVACLVIVVIALLIVRKLTAGGPQITFPSKNDTTTPPSVTIENEQTPSLAPKYYGDPESVTYDVTHGEIVTTGVSVTARLVEALPDTYTFFDDWSQTEFRLVKMEIVKLHTGTANVKYFYYIIPTSYMTDYSVYDSFVIVDMGQYGTGYSVLYNKTEQCAEQLDLVLMGYKCNSFGSLNCDFMAFDSEGNLDSRMWKSTEAWRKHTACVLDPEANYYMGDYTLEKAVSEIDPSGHDIKLFTAHSSQSSEAYEYVRSFDNGIYATYSDGFLAKYNSTSLPLRRYINGFPTNDYITIGFTSVTRSDAQFTNADMKKLPNLASAYASIIKEYESGSIAPPHIVSPDESKLYEYGIFAWYAKTENGVVGVVRVNWFYNMSDWFYDDAYYIIEYGADTYTSIERDALIERLGASNPSYVYTGEYDENGKVLGEINIP